MTINRRRPRPDTEVRQAAAAFARANGWQSAVQLLTSFGPFLAGCAAMYLVYPGLLAADAGARRADRRAAGAHLHRPARLRARLVLRLAARQHAGRAGVQPGHAHALRQLGRQHGLHHADWNNLDRTGGGSDIYSACLTVREYLALSPWRRFLYRLPRHPLIANVLLPPLVFLLLYRVPFDTPRAWARERWSVYLTNPALICLFGTLAMPARLAGGAAGPSADHGRGVDPGRLAVLAAAPLRDGALDGQGRLELRRRGARGLVMVPPAARAALADRQYRLPPRPPSRSPRAQLPAERRPRGRARAASGAAAQPVARPRRDVPHAVGRASAAASCASATPRLEPGSGPRHWTH